MNDLGRSNQDQRRSPESATPAAALWPLIRALRVHRTVAIAIVLLTVFSSVLWLAKRSPQYSASTDVLVTPLSATDRSFSGLPLLRAVGPDASSGVGSAVTLLDSAEAAALTAKRLGSGLTAESVQESVEAERSEDAGLVTVTARSDNAELAAAMADEFVEASLDVRADQLDELARQQIERSEELLGEASSSGFLADENLRARIADLEQIIASGDPTLSVGRRASVPGAPDGAPAPAILLVSFIGGLAIACMTIILIEVLGPSQIFDEATLQEIYDLPILARLPRLGGGDPDLAPAAVRARTKDVQRNLRSQLDIQVRGRPRSSNGSAPRTTRAIAITSPSRGDGRTTAAAGLAHAILAAGDSCSILDLDVATRGAETLLGADRPHAAYSQPVGGSGSGFARAPVRGDSGLELLTVTGNPASVEASLTRADDLVELGRASSDWVILDTSPLPDAAETLPALKVVDALLIVVKLRSTARSDLFRLREILELVDIEALGYVVVAPEGVSRRRRRAQTRRRRRGSRARARERA